MINRVSLAAMPSLSLTARMISSPPTKPPTTARLTATRSSSTTNEVFPPSLRTHAPHLEATQVRRRQGLPQAHQGGGRPARQGGKSPPRQAGPRGAGALAQPQTQPRGPVEAKGAEGQSGEEGQEGEEGEEGEAPTPRRGVPVINGPNRIIYEPGNRKQLLPAHRDAHAAVLQALQEQ